jgi:hypothetical protein
MYESLFAEMKGAKLAINVQSSRLLAPGVAIEEGISELKQAEGGPPALRGPPGKHAAVLCPGLPAHALGAE